MFFYDVGSNLNLTYTLGPEENVNTFTKIGSNMIYRSNTGFSEQFWYTSLKWGTTRVLNSITFFKESRADFWEYTKKENILELTMADTDDFLVYQMIGDNVIYKKNSGTDLRTFLSCPYNYRWNITQK